MTRDTWRWLLRDEAGQELATGPARTFAARVDAEAWLGENWRTLSAATAQLLHGDEPVGPLVPLREPGA